MKISLLSFDQELFCIGIRILSSCLKKAGHDVHCLFLPPKAGGGTLVNKFRTTYSPDLLDAIYLSIKDSDLIGMSLMSNQFIQARDVTLYLKKRDLVAPIIWGGIQPTVEPEICLEYADIVCLGEGEDALLELVSKMKKGKSIYDTENMWFQRNGNIQQNPMKPLRQDLDSLPYPDYSCKNHYIAEKNTLVPLSKETFLTFKGERFQHKGTEIPYMIMTSRGCPFSCSYCCNSVYAKLYPKQKRLRFRNIEGVIQELQMIQEQLTSISIVYIVDDNFTSRPTKDLEQFCERYRNEINIPFYCQISPLTINEKKMGILFDSACYTIAMGVESANKRVAEIYNRGHFHNALKDAIALVEKYRPMMKAPPTYQFIIDNPYETLDEMIETLKLAVSFPRPWRNPVYSLMFFPGTPLFEKAIKDGLIENSIDQIYGRNWLEHSKPFLRFWVRLYRANYPPFLLRFLLLRYIAHTLSSKPADYIWHLPIIRLLW